MSMKTKHRVHQFAYWTIDHEKWMVMATCGRLLSKHYFKTRITKSKAMVTCRDCLDAIEKTA